jgi:hypothetical protein
LVIYLSDIASLKMLESLKLIDVQVDSSDNNISVLKSSTSIRNLKLTSSNILGESKSLSSLVKLESLVLRNVDVTVNIDDFSGFKLIKKLIIDSVHGFISGCTRSLKGLTELTRLKLLTVYSAFRWDIRHLLPEQPTLYGDLIDLSVLTKLRVLHLMRTDIAGDMTSLCSLSNLESLQLHNCTKIKRIRCDCRLPVCCRCSFSDLANTGPMLHCTICLFSYY